MDAYSLSALYQKAHDSMRNIDGLQPQEAFDELLKYIFFKESSESQEQETAKNRRLPLNDGISHDDLLLTKKIRSIFKINLRNANGWIKYLWKDTDFLLTDKALYSLHELFKGVSLNALGFDTKSNALKTFLSPELRRGLGIFLTPDDVARMMVETVAPDANMRVLDPACGSGTFLIEVLKFWKNHYPDRTYNIYGSDINPRMMMLAELNISHERNVKFQRIVRDILWPVEPEGWLVPESFDIILTNPPFGVVINTNNYSVGAYESCINPDGSHKRRQQSEVLFLERCLRLLKPTGLLGIVLPKSIMSNAAFDHARDVIGELGFVQSVLMLPPETFALAGTQTTTVILLIRKYDNKLRALSKVSISYFNIKNVGYDSTGRNRQGNELIHISELIKHPSHGSKGVEFQEFPNVQASKSLSSLSSIITKNNNSSKGEKLGDLCELIHTGKTPSRDSYTEGGLFIVKVGNLTGKGINWIPRERNFVGNEEREARIKSGRLMLAPNDILITSSAHNPKYIAAKADLVYKIPDLYNQEATFVGEIMLIRLKKGLNPFGFLAFFQRDSVVDKIQKMVRGQTAHLMREDMSELTIPLELATGDATGSKLTNLLKQELELSYRMNMLRHEINELLD